MRRATGADIWPGMWVISAARYDELRALKRDPWNRSTVVREVVHNPVGCRGKAHVIAADGRMECWDHVAEVVVY